jgi:hypothetical protein
MSFFKFYECYFRSSSTFFHSLNLGIVNTELNTYNYLGIVNKKRRAYPSISIIRLRRSNSEAPGNNGNPRNNSATMHPKDHMSIAVVYLEKKG